MNEDQDAPNADVLTAKLWGCVDAEQAAHVAIEYMTPWLKPAPNAMPSIDELVEKLYPVIEENSGQFMAGGLSPSWNAWVKLLVESTVDSLQPWLTKNNGDCYE